MFKHFSMAGDTAFYAFKERIEQKFFRNNFCFWMVTELWVKPYLNFGRIFQGVVNGAIYVSRGTFRGESIFFQNSKQIFISELGQKYLSFPYQNVPGTTIKNGLFSCRLTHSTKLFSRETFHLRCLNWILRGKIPAELSRNGLRWQKDNWGNCFFTSNDLILDIVISDWTKFFGF